MFLVLLDNITRDLTKKKYWSIGTEKVFDGSDLDLPYPQSRHIKFQKSFQENKNRGVVSE